MHTAVCRKYYHQLLW